MFTDKRYVFWYDVDRNASATIINFCIQKVVIRYMLSSSWVYLPTARYLQRAGRTGKRGRPSQTLLARTPLPARGERHVGVALGVCRGCSAVVVRDGVWAARTTIGRFLARFARCARPP